MGADGAGIVVADGGSDLLTDPVVGVTIRSIELADEGRQGRGVLEALQRKTGGGVEHGGRAALRGRKPIGGANTSGPCSEILFVIVFCFTIFRYLLLYLHFFDKVKYWIKNNTKNSNIFFHSQRKQK